MIRVLVPGLYILINRTQLRLKINRSGADLYRVGRMKRKMCIIKWRVFRLLLINSRYMPARSCR